MEYSTNVANQEIVTELAPFFPGSVKDSISETIASATSVDQMLLSKPVPISEVVYGNSIVNPLGPMTEYAMDDALVESLTIMYTLTLRDHTLVHVSCLCRRFVWVKLAGKLYSSQLAKIDRNNFICATWLGSDNKSIDTATSCRPGCIQFFLKHTTTVQYNHKQSLLTTYLTFVQWYKVHPEKNYLYTPNTIWYPDYEPLSEASFMPISRITCRCMQGEHMMLFPERLFNNAKVIVINPISCANLEF